MFRGLRSLRSFLVNRVYSLGLHGVAERVYEGSSSATVHWKRRSRRTTETRCSPGTASEGTCCRTRGARTALKGQPVSPGRRTSRCHEDRGSDSSPASPSFEGGQVAIEESREALGGSQERPCPGQLEQAPFRASPRTVVLAARWPTPPLRPLLARPSNDPAALSRIAQRILRSLYPRSSLVSPLRFESLGFSSLPSDAIQFSLPTVECIFQLLVLPRAD